MEIQEIVKLIKANKKYKDISEAIVENKIKEVKNWEKQDEKALVKQVRSELHKIHGSFRLNDKKLEEYLKNKDFIGLLDSNRSTRERLLEFEKIYEKIFAVTGKPSSILDLGCGLNPCSIPLMKLKSELKYYAFDINEKEVSFLNSFFRAFNIEGEAKVRDLSVIENVAKLPSAEVCLAFKLLDVLEKDGHKYSEEMIKTLNEKCNFIVVSFAKQTVSGKTMNFPQRGWIERMLTRIEMKFEKFEIESEIFYIIKKK